MGSAGGAARPSRFSPLNGAFLPRLTLAAPAEPGVGSPRVPHAMPFTFPILDRGGESRHGLRRLGSLRLGDLPERGGRRSADYRVVVRICADKVDCNRANTCCPIRSRYNSVATFKGL